ncbi:MAG: type II secretion system protein [Akkermansiaceae bacterium]|jgi:prepilin-type N-terminal cleavage/methylation domain-containing protein|tara:strand:+ start:16456 stop:16992 length:537 start_codon:yes stop_codon:yes gene_type:complete
MLTKNITKHSGFTLIEMTVTMVVGLMIAAMSLTMFNQQLASYDILRTQNFLITEAPHVNNTLNRIVSRANFFRMYANLEDAESSQNAVIQDGKVLALKFEDSGDQSESSFGVIAFDATENDLNYYHLSSMAELAVASPQWSISTQLSDAVLYVENGVMRIKLTGPNGEEIIYSTTTQR